MDPSSAIAIFHSILDGFSLIQLARDFENEFERYQLKLDMIQLRISRWGQISGLIRDNESNSVIPSSANSSATTLVPTDDTGLVESPTQDLAKETLIAIRDTVAKARRDATRVKTGLTPNVPLPLEPEAAMPVDLKALRNRWMRILDKRRVQKNKVVDSIKWAFYKRDHFNTFIADVSSLADEFEKLAPAESIERLQIVSSEECQGLNKPNLEELQSIAEECDPWLKKAMEKALAMRGRTTTYKITQSYNQGMVTGVHHGRIDVKGINNGNNNTVNNNWDRAY